MERNANPGCPPGQFRPFRGRAPDRDGPSRLPSLLQDGRPQAMQPGTSVPGNRVCSVLLTAATLLTECDGFDIMECEPFRKHETTAEGSRYLDSPVSGIVHSTGQATQC